MPRPVAAAAPIAAARAVGRVVCAPATAFTATKSSGGSPPSTRPRVPPSAGGRPLGGTAAADGASEGGGVPVRGAVSVRLIGAFSPAGAALAVVEHPHARPTGCRVAVHLLA